MASQVRTVQRSDARDNRLRILTVARAAYANDGLDVTIREIARRADVGPATLYRHFPTREALMTEAFADQMISCREIIEEGLATEDPWEGFSFVIEKLMQVHALNRGFARAFTSELPHAIEFATERDHSLQRMRDLIRRAKATGALRTDFTLADVSLVLMANEGIRAESPARRVAASRRFAAFIIRSFREQPSLTQRR
ncbi:TetR/AcrR family transcriptional regulator [Glaciihabitans sp. UYNi722]|uniref:TetR/AcrR family transcriptional regulator n=1 Tax=Glaciihabitans sp. UYNi722 TaxID=3156344 RepID=UPI0033923595